MTEKGVGLQQRTACLSTGHTGPRRTQRPLVRIMHSHSLLLLAIVPCLCLTFALCMDLRSKSQPDVRTLEYATTSHNSLSAQGQEVGEKGASGSPGGLHPSGLTSEDAGQSGSRSPADEGRGTDERSTKRKSAISLPVTAAERWVNTCEGFILNTKPNLYVRPINIVRGDHSIYVFCWLSICFREHSNSKKQRVLPNEGRST